MLSSAEQVTEQRHRIENLRSSMQRWIRVSCTGAIFLIGDIALNVAKGNVGRIIDAVRNHTPMSPDLLPVLVSFAGFTLFTISTLEWGAEFRFPRLKRELVDFHESYPDAPLPMERLTFAERILDRWTGTGISDFLNDHPHHR